MATIEDVAKQKNKVRTIIQHVRFKTLYISLPSSTKQQREITKIWVVYERKLRRQIIQISN